MTNAQRLQELAELLPGLVQQATKPTVAKSFAEKERLNREHLTNPPLLQLAKAADEIRMLMREILAGRE